MNSIQQPKELPFLFAQYWNERNASGIASLFVDDADFVNVVGLWWNNRADIEKAHDYGLKVIFSESNLKVIRTKTRFLSDEIAIVHAKMKLTNQLTPGNENLAETRRNIFTFLVQKFSDKWNCMAAHNTDIMPGKETNFVIDGQMTSIDYRKKQF